MVGLMELQEVIIQLEAAVELQQLVELEDLLRVEVQDLEVLEQLQVLTEHQQLEQQVEMGVLQQVQQEHLKQITLVMEVHLEDIQVQPVEPVVQV